MKIRGPLLFSLGAIAGVLALPALPAEPGLTAGYRHETGAALRDSVVRTFSVKLGPVEKRAGRDYQWLSLNGTTAGGRQFRLWILSAGYPAATLEAARASTARYLFQEGATQPREYRNLLTGEAVLPAMGGWEYLIPRPVPGEEAGGPFPQNVRYLGHRYVRESLEPASVEPPPSDARVVMLRPDLLIGPATNNRQKDPTRRYDESDYEMVRFVQDDYRQLRDAGATCVLAEGEQVAWADELGLYYWRGGNSLPYPEFLYRSQYLGPALYLDEPAVVTRDYTIRPRLAKDEAFRRALSPQIVLEAFQKHYDQVLREGAPVSLIRGLRARKDVDVGTMDFAQENLYSWETMVSTSAYQLSRDPRVPEAMVFEPPGRIGTRRTLPEMNMTYGVQLPLVPQSLTGVIFGFLRGAARLTNKSWGVSIYGSVSRDDAPVWLTHAYNLGGTRFFFWDNHRLACVPFPEVLALARHLQNHASNQPLRDLTKLRQAAEVAILLPPGYDLGHVQTGKGNMWGVGELNLERINRRGVKHRVVMSNFFTEIERCLRLGVEFDLLWDLPGKAVTGYRETVRIREDGKVEVTQNGKTAVTGLARVPVRPGGEPPRLSVVHSAQSGPDAVEVTARARVVETTAPVFYTFGADTTGIHHNALVAWEVFGPHEEDEVYLMPAGLKPKVDPARGQVEVTFKLKRPGSYRLRAATVDLAGRSTVVWRRLEVSRQAGQLVLVQGASR
ncbi:MAG: hypothetical protein ACKV22_08010 [Bryobacteraceae bacterium]